MTMRKIIIARVKTATNAGGKMASVQISKKESQPMCTVRIVVNRSVGRTVLTRTKGSSVSI